MQLTVPWRRGQKNPWTSIPRINRDHPLARGLVFYAYDTGTGNVVDLVAGLRGAPTSAFGPSSTPFGSRQTYTSGGPNVAFPNSANVVGIFPATRYTIATAWYITALPSITFTSPFCVCDTVANLAVGVFFNQTATNDLQVEFSNHAGTILSGVNTINTFHSIVGTNTAASAQSMYFDGKFDTSTAVASTITATAYRPAMNTSQIAGSLGNGVAGQVFYGALWNRTLTSVEALQLHLDPYCFLIYPEDDIFASLINVPGAAPVITARSSLLPMMGVG